jgi:hypothetical protein
MGTGSVVFFATGLFCACKPVVSAKAIHVICKAFNMGFIFSFLLDRYETQKYRKWGVLYPVKKRTATFRQLSNNVFGVHQTLVFLRISDRFSDLDQFQFFFGLDRFLSDLDQFQFFFGLDRFLSDLDQFQFFFGFDRFLSDLVLDFRLSALTIQRCKPFSPSHNLFGEGSKTFVFWVFLGVDRKEKAPGKSNGAMSSDISRSQFMV